MIYQSICRIIILKANIPHGIGLCLCRSRNIIVESKSRLEITGDIDRKSLLAKFSHPLMNALSLILEYNGTLRYTQIIRRECANEI